MNSWFYVILSYALYFISVNIRKVLIFANFARRTNSRIRESRNFFFIIAILRRNENSRILNFVKSPKLK